MVYENRRWRRLSYFGYMLNGIVLLSVCLIVVGLVLGWFSFSVRNADTESDERFAMTMYVNTDKFWDSAEEVKEEAVGLKDVMSEASELEVVDGKLLEVDHESRRITLAPDSEETERVLIHIDEETEIKLDSETNTFSSLSADQNKELSVTFVEVDGAKIAKKISEL